MSIPCDNLSIFKPVSQSGYSIWSSDCNQVICLKTLFESWKRKHKYIIKYYILNIISNTWLYVFLIIYNKSIRSSFQLWGLLTLCCPVSMLTGMQSIWNQRSFKMSKFKWEKHVIVTRKSEKIIFSMFTSRIQTENTHIPILLFFKINK